MDKPSFSRRQVVNPALVVMWLLMLVAPVAAEPTGQSSAPAPHQKLTGVVSKVQSGVVFLQTPVGRVTLSSKFVEKGGLVDAQVGQEVTMWVNESNIVIDVSKKGEAAPVYRLVSGNLSYTSDQKTEIKLWTPQGERAFSVARNKSKLSAVQEGTPVTLELNQAGEVIDVHRMEVGLEVAPTGLVGAGSQTKLTGVVSKIKSGLVFVKTKVGVATFGKEMKMKGLAVGDEVVLQINGNNSVIDVYRKGAPVPVHLFITGNLVYTSDLKTEIKLWTPEGEKTFPVIRGKSKLSVIKEGTPITVELNEAGKMIDMRKAD